jgi:hypothetical protein
MLKRILAVAFIFLVTAVAWAILGATIFARTEESGSRLKGRVVSTWGAPHKQVPPKALYDEIVPRKVESVEDGKKIVRLVEDSVTRSLPLQSSRIRVGLDLEHRQKGLLWYSTYKVAFSGSYRFRNDTGKDRDVTFALSFPAAQAIYDDLVFTVDGTPVEIRNEKTAASGTATVAAGKTAELNVAYRSQGLESWRYSFGSEVSQVRDYLLAMTTNFKEVDFPDSTLSPTFKREIAGGWELTWEYKNLVSGFEIGITMPEKLQPGPLAGRMSFFAPVCLFFFFFLMLIITTMRGIDLHPMNYFFLAAAFFAFHLLMAYLVDHISIHAAFAISALVSVFLVISYLRLVVGMRFAAVEAGITQLIYLVLFSYAFFFKGFTGLVITIGSILTLFVVMQMTGRVKWAEKF